MDLEETILITQVAELISKHIIEVVIAIAAIYLTATLLIALYDRTITYPTTRFGFKGKLVYVDDSPTVKAFVNHRYELAAKPDFLFKVGFNKYVTVEYKSRKGKIKESDIAQLHATALAVRSQKNVIGGYIVTGSENRYFKFGSNHSVYKHIKNAHKTAKSIKLLNKLPKDKLARQCNNCGYNYYCNQQG